MNTKLSISINPHWAAFLEKYKDCHKIKTKSQVVERALKALQEIELEASYEEAMTDYIKSGDREHFDKSAGDGLEHESR